MLRIGKPWIAAIAVAACCVLATPALAAPENTATPHQASDSTETIEGASTKTRVGDGAAATSANYDFTITTSSEQADVTAALASGETVLVEAGGYTGKTLKVTNRTTLVVSGEVKLGNGQENLKALEVDNGAIKGETGASTDKIICVFNTYAFPAAAYFRNDTVLENVTLDITGDNDNCLLCWYSGDLTITNAALLVNGNLHGCGLWVDKGASGKTFTATDSDVSFSNNRYPDECYGLKGDGGAGIQADADSELTNNPVFRITGGTFKMNDNDLNGVQCGRSEKHIQSFSTSQIARLKRAGTAKTLTLLAPVTGSPMPMSPSRVELSKRTTATATA